jgi:hypothetical protein
MGEKCPKETRLQRIDGPIRLLNYVLVVNCHRFWFPHSLDSSRHDNQGVVKTTHQQQNDKQIHAHLLVAQHNTSSFVFDTDLRRFGEI